MKDLLVVLKAGITEAVKSGDKQTRDILKTLVGDIENKSLSGKPMTDNDIIALIKKYIANNTDTLKLAVNDEARNRLEFENELLSWYLPIQLSEKDIYNRMYASGLNTVGELMKHMKDKYAGTYDGKIASKVAKQLEDEYKKHMTFEEYIQATPMSADIIQVLQDVHGPAWENEKIDIYKRSYNDYLEKRQSL